MIRHATSQDAAAIARVYNHYIETTTVSFEEVPVTPAEITRRMAKVQADGWPWYVYVEDEEVMGYAYASCWNERSAYRHSAELSTYLNPAVTGKGMGSQLLSRLINDMVEQGMHTVIAGIALPNPASVALYEKFGFTQVAHYKEVGWKQNRWIDVAYWQRML